MNEIKEHAAPAWGERANFVLQLRIETGDAQYDAAMPRWEQVWTKQRSDDLYEVCCIPFFLYDLALGDVLKVVTRDGAAIVEGVAEKSGHHTFRAWFGGAFLPVARDQLLVELLTLPDCLFEWHGQNLLAIDAADDAAANIVAQRLEAAQSRGQLQYETGRTK